MRVIILSKSNYKEKDCIYNAISPEGFISFLAKGAQDPKSRFIWLNNPLTVADINFLEDGRYKHKVISDASLVSSPMISASNLDYYKAINAMNELTRNIIPDEEKAVLFNEVEPALNALRAGKDYYMTILVYTAKLISLGGAELNVDECVLCKSKQNIVSFSFVDGGFLCGNCVNEDSPKDLSKNQLLLLRYIFKARDYSLPEIEKYTLEDKKVILLKLRDFIDEFLAVKLNTFDELAK